jgi:hypothetical protein
MPKTMGIAEIEHEALRQQVSTPVSSIVAALQDVLGQKLVAYLAGVGDHKAVGPWARETRQPRPAARARLEHAYRVLVMLKHATGGPQLIRAWFTGLNPQLADRSPATAIRDDDYLDVIVAARTFITG